MAFSLSVHIYITQQTILDIQYCGAEAARPKFFFLAGAGAVQKWIGFRRNNAKKYSPRPLLNLKSAKLYNQLKDIKNNGQL